MSGVIPSFSADSMHDPQEVPPRQKVICTNEPSSTISPTVRMRNRQCNRALLDGVKRAHPPSYWGGKNLAGDRGVDSAQRFAPSAAIFHRFRIFFCATLHLARLLAGHSGAKPLILFSSWRSCESESFAAFGMDGRVFCSVHPRFTTPRARRNLHGEQSEFPDTSCPRLLRHAATSNALRLHGRSALAGRVRRQHHKQTLPFSQDRLPSPLRRSSAVASLPVGFAPGA